MRLKIGWEKQMINEENSLEAKLSSALVALVMSCVFHLSSYL